MSAGIMTTINNSATANILNCYNQGNIKSIVNSSAGIAGVNNTGNFKDNVTNGVKGITATPIQMTEAQMKASTFVNTLNTNKNSINLADYGLTDYTLSSWKTGTDGYPAFDW